TRLGFPMNASGYTSTDVHCSIIPCEIMALTIGTQLGSHEITGLLGKGGMGEVYRARDLKLKREVAIKILPEEFARDADRVSRFHREAEVLASLNHPNIAGIHDLQESDGLRYLILELVEGVTLAIRIGHGPIPVDEALAIAKQICEALEAAHEKGIIHRDLKPANVKITPDGKGEGPRLWPRKGDGEYSCQFNAVEFTDDAERDDRRCDCRKCPL